MWRGFRTPSPSNCGRRPAWHRFGMSQKRNDEARRLIEPVYGWFSEGQDTDDLRRAREVRIAAAGSGISD